VGERLISELKSESAQDCEVVLPAVSSTLSKMLEKYYLSV
jgi:hypothetical protein